MLSALVYIPLLISGDQRKAKKIEKVLCVLSVSAVKININSAPLLGVAFDWPGTGQKNRRLYMSMGLCSDARAIRYVSQRSHPGIASVSFFADQRVVIGRTRKTPPQVLIIPRHVAALFGHI